MQMKQESWDIFVNLIAVTVLLQLHEDLIDHSGYVVKSSTK